MTAGQRPSTACLDENTVAAYFESWLSVEESQRLIEHVDQCASCARLFEAVAAIFPAGGDDDAGAARTLEATPLDAAARATPLDAAARATPLDAAARATPLERPRGGRIVADAERNRDTINSALDAAELGSDFDGYRIIKPVGAGAMGQVYLGHDTLLDRAVAIKFIAGSEPDTATRERFRIEARAIARLTHPNVVAVYRVGELHGRPYLISEFVRGKNLAQLVLPLPHERVVHIGVRLGRGLAAAHRRGVLHRDLKLANAILDEDDEVKLVDFGLAKLDPPVAAERLAVAATLPVTPSRTLGTTADTTPPSAPVAGSGEASPRLTNPGALVGTPLYMAPEVWLGESATARSDIYSIGVMLYELCSGRVPHRERNPTRLGQRVMQNDAPPLVSVAHTVDPALAAIVDRCLKRDPELRFASADELRDALEQIAGVATAPLPEGNPYRGLRPFEAEHRGMFFGRGRAVRDLVERLRSESFVVVAGDSGVGKSSLCRAGVVPTVTGGGFGERRRWSSLVMVPGQHPLMTLRALLALELGDEALGDDARDIARVLRRQHGDAAGLVILVDQLEELITLSDPVEADQFATLLISLAEPHTSVRVLATARGDFLTRLAGIAELGPRLGRALYLLQALPPEGIREAVVGPARRKGVRFESEELVETLVSATAGAEGGLPLLQFALAELWEVRDPAAEMITAASLEKLGGVVGALARHADGVLAALRPGQRTRAQAILAKLVTVEGTRAHRSEAELGLHNADEAAVDTDQRAADSDQRAALEALIRGRLVVARESNEGTVHELAHEALIKGWPALRGWLDGAAESRAVKQRLERAVSEWQRLARRDDALWTERQLSELSVVDANELGAAERAFVSASRRALRRVRLRRQGLVAGVLLTIALVYGVVRLRARAELHGRVAVHLAHADADLSQARQRNRAVEAVRATAFAAFDRDEKAPAEAAWSAALREAAEVHKLYESAGETLENALLLDGARQDVKQLLVAVLYERALLAERDYRPDERDELLRRMSLYDADGTMERKWQAPARLTVATTPPGARVHIDRYVSDEKQRRIATPVADMTGSTPFSVTLPPGSYLLILTLPGHVTVRYPVLLARGEQLDVQIRLPAADAIPAGFVYIPRGRFVLGFSGDETLRGKLFGTSPAHAISTDAYLIARTETTFAQWIDYLEHLPLPERGKRTPKAPTGFDGAISLARVQGTWQVTMQPTIHSYAALAGEHLHYEKRALRTDQDWLKFPVSGISGDDAKAFAAWLDQTGRLPGARLCTELEWERAARGADTRLYPHGDSLSPDDANFDETYGREPLAFGPDEVGSHPASDSPFGVSDMTGNVWERASGSMSVVRGGAFYFDPLSGATVNRAPIASETRHLTIGFRLCVTAREKI
jgi:serine/threonine protein kinase/formylglycine-generating enzyme required for sulfatase activity